MSPSECRFLNNKSSNRFSKPRHEYTKNQPHREYPHHSSCRHFLFHPVFPRLFLNSLYPIHTRNHIFSLCLPRYDLHFVLMVELQQVVLYICIYICMYTSFFQLENKPSPFVSSSSQCGNSCLFCLNS